MKTVSIYDLTSAPKASKPLLEKSVKDFGMVPNLHGVMAGAPALLEAYQTLHALFMSTSFDDEERTVVWQTINVEHDCHYCVPAHTAIAHSMDVDAHLTDALRHQASMPTEKLQVLHDTTLKIVRKRGVLAKNELNTFFAAGYGEQQLLEIILGVSQKVMSNYVNHIAQTPIDTPFSAFAWEKASVD
ncbi:MAG: carboxymuconolactone decarboxylase family protein [Arenicella sp.]